MGGIFSSRRGQREDREDQDFPKTDGRIIDCVKQHERGGNCAVLCILEVDGMVEDILDTAKCLCSGRIQFNPPDNKLLDRSAVRLLEIASNHNIPITKVFLNDCYGTVSGGNHLQLKSSISMPVLTTLNVLTIGELGREITAEEFAAILQYSSKCLALKELEIYCCLLPQSVRTESVSVLRSRNVEVLWQPIRHWYRLDLEFGHWGRIEDYYDDRHIIGVMTDADYQELRGLLIMET